VNWTDFPVMNMHPHAWTLYDIVKLIGIEFTPEGVELMPSLPKSEYRFASPILGLEKSKEGYSGWYSPDVAGKWQITLRIPKDERDRFTSLEINDEVRPLTRAEDGTLQWSTESSPGKPLRWVLK